MIGGRVQHSTCSTPNQTTRQFPFPTVSTGNTAWSALPSLPGAAPFGCVAQFVDHMAACKTHRQTTVGLRGPGCASVRKTPSLCKQGGCMWPPGCRALLLEKRECTHKPLHSTITCQQVLSAAPRVSNVAERPESGNAQESGAHTYRPADAQKEQPRHNP